jgi:quercetin dioxygenase-like cupin family protein
MKSFHLDDILAERGRADRAYLEFLRVPSLSMGVYQIKAGQPDHQRPHTEDEVYHVLAGRGRFRAGAAEQAVGPGTILFVDRSVEHRFVNVTEDLTVLVFFAPAEGSAA